MNLKKTYMRLSKQVLGVHSKESNFAVVSELGQFPLIISVLANCIGTRVLLSVLSLVKTLYMVPNDVS